MRPTVECPTVTVVIPTFEYGETIVEEPTYFSQGLKHVRQSCTVCSYRNQYERILPRKQMSTSSSGYSGGGGGGGGDGFSGGGGGESGGGGMSRED